MRAELMIKKWHLENQRHWAVSIPVENTLVYKERPKRYTVDKSNRLHLLVKTGQVAWNAMMAIDLSAGGILLVSDEPHGYSIGSVHEVTLSTAINSGWMLFKMRAKIRHARHVVDDGKRKFATHMQFADGPSHELEKFFVEHLGLPEKNDSTQQ
jgi:hypothetical protein